MTVEEINLYMAKESENYGDSFVDITNNIGILKDWKPDSGKKQWKVFRNKEFFVQLFQEGTGIIRITVNRCKIKSIGRWVDGITWDELQKIKSDLGYGHRDAVEIYPKDKDVVDVANMRHLWVLPEHSLNFIWRHGK